MPLSPTFTRELLQQLEHIPNKRLGQNFLVDGNIVRKSVKLAEVSEGDCVVEVGPGLGTLTKAVLETGARVWAVERDARLAKHIRDQLLRQQSNLRLIEGDCLNYPLAGLPIANANDRYKIVANLPYAVSTPWMDAVIAGPLPDRMVLMLQKETADRYGALHCSKTFGAISIFLQSAFDLSSKHPVSAKCFHPSPKVDSVLLCLDRRTDCVRFSPIARDYVRRIFTRRRKQLGALCKGDKQTGAIEWFKDLIKRGISPTIRAEELALAHWHRLADYLE